MASKVLELNAEGPEETRAEAGAGKDETRADGAVVEVEEAEVGRAEDGGALDLLPLAFWGPRKVTEGSSRFQQFFFT